MDGTRFDRLIKTIATQRVSRLTALRGLAAGGVAALTGMSLVGEEAEAAKKKGSQKKRKACDCQSADPNTCSDKTLSRRRRKKLLRNNLCAYAGRCKSGVSGCQRVGCQIDADCTSGLVCINNICQSRGGGAGCSPPTNIRGSCPEGQVCNTFSICVPAVGCLDIRNEQCSGSQVCCPSETERAGLCRGTLQGC
jgi:hypothetical protein